jgi:hypothetical protein
MLPSLQVSPSPPPLVKPLNKIRRSSTENTNDGNGSSSRNGSRERVSSGGGSSLENVAAANRSASSTVKDATTRKLSGNAGPKRSSFGKATPPPKPKPPSSTAKPGSTTSSGKGKAPVAGTTSNSSSTSSIAKLMASTASSVQAKFGVSSQKSQGGINFQISSEHGVEVYFSRNNV